MDCCQNTVSKCSGSSFFAPFQTPSEKMRQKSENVVEKNSFMEMKIFILVAER